MMIDELDEAIIDLLSKDGRQSNRKIGRTLGYSEGVIRKRLKRLQAEGAFRLNLVTDVSSCDLNSFAYVRLSVAPSKLADVSRSIAKLDECGYAAITSGQYDAMVFLTCTDRAALQKLIDEKIASLDGVRDIDVQEPVGVYKHRFDLVRLLEDK